MTKFSSVEEYLDAQPEATRAAVGQVIERVHGVVPGAREVISYDMPTFEVEGRRFLHVAGWKNHLSLYPRPSSDPALIVDMEPYTSGEGTLKFPLSEPLPLALVERVAVALASEVTATRE
jgi:uncharacterized protein YdhG (YjbR/CyaY superfamily)